MKRNYLFTALAILATSTSLFGQSQLTQQLQQKLKSRQTPQSQEDDSAAPTAQPKQSIASFQAKSPQEFADAIHLAVLSNNLEAFNGLVSWATLAKKATSRLNGKPIEDFEQNLLKDVKGNSSLGAKIIHNVRTGGSYEFMQLKKNNNTVVAIFRMLLPKGRGVNYHEYALAKTKSGQVVASDIYICLTGEFLSESIRRNLITALHESKESSKIRFAGHDKMVAEHVATIKSLTTALSKNDAKTAREQILKMPAELRKDKAIQALTLNIYKNSTAFVTVLESVRKSHPEDVFMDMIAIDVLVKQKKYDKVIEAIERINERTGGDPHMKILHGRMLLNKDDQANGRRMIKEAISEDDSLITGYWNLVSFSLQDEDHKETLRLLKLIHSKFKIKFKDLREIPSYKNFIKTPEFKLWTDYLESNASPAPASDDVSANSKQSNRRGAKITLKTSE